MHIVNVSIAIIVDSIAWDLPRVDPKALDEVRVQHINPRVDDGDHYIRGAWRAASGDSKWGTKDLRWRARWLGLSRLRLGVQ